MRRGAPRATLTTLVLLRTRVPADPWLLSRPGAPFCCPQSFLRKRIRLSDTGRTESPGRKLRRFDHGHAGLLTRAFDAPKKAAHRINRFCVAAFLTAASGMLVSKVTSRPAC